MPQPGFSLFIEQVIGLYERSRVETDMRKVIRRCESVLRQLEHYEPTDDDEEINIETASELFEELRARAKVRLNLGR